MSFDDIIEQNQKYTFIPPLPNFSTKYLVLCKVYTDVGGIK